MSVMERAIDEKISTSDGYSISVRRYEAAGAHAALIVAPAMAIKQAFYAPFAAWMASRGVTVYTFDYRGMGASRPEQLRGFEADILDWATKDCAAVLDAAERAAPGRPIFWLGHSVGAQILGLVPGVERVRAMMSVAAGSGYWRLNARPLRYYALPIWWVLVPVAIRVAGYFPGKKLRTVGDLPYGVANQWRRWCLSPAYLGGESAAVREQLARVTTPITALSMVDDEMMTFPGTTSLFGLYKSSPVEYRRLRPAEYGVRRIGHFGFFRPTAGPALWPLAERWMDEALGRGEMASSAA